MAVVVPGAVGQAAATYDQLAAYLVGQNIPVAGALASPARPGQGVLHIVNTLIPQLTQQITATQGQLTRANCNIAVITGMLALTVVAVGTLFYISHGQDAIIAAQGQTIGTQGKTLSKIEQRLASLETEKDTTNHKLASLETEKGATNLCKTAYKNCDEKNQKLITEAHNALSLSQQFEDGWKECVNNLEACEKK